MPEPIVDPAKQDNPQDDPAKIQANLPEKFKGKSPEEIAQSYIELEKEYTKTRQEHNLTKQEMANLKALESFIDNDPETLQFLDQKIKGKSEKQTVTPKNEPNAEVEQLRQEVSDGRLATQGQIFDKFEGKYHFDRLKAEESDTLRKRIGTEIKAMLDPTGPKTPSQVIAQIPLNSLPMYLEKAYQLATVDDEKERIRRKTLTEARQNGDATFSSIPSGSVKIEDIKLSAQEKTVAKGLGISEEKYLEQKKNIAKEYQDQ